MKNLAFSRLGNMSHLHIQKGKEAMETSEFQKYFVGTAACMKRLAMATKWCGKLTYNDTYFSDSWFSSVNTAEEAIAARVDYCGPVKTSHKGFCLAPLEKLMKYWLGGSYLVMKIILRVPGGRPLLEILYKYNSRKVLGSISTEGDGNTEPGDPYLSRFPDIHSNVSFFPSVCIHLIGMYFNACNEIVNHNRMASV